MAIRKRRSHTEDSFHARVAEHLDWILPLEFWHSCFPAGGGGFKRGQWLKRRGLKTGVPDHMVCRPLQYGTAGVLWIELKTKRNKLSPAQIITIDELQRLGHTVVVCRTLAEVELAVENFCRPYPLRARLAA